MTVAAALMATGGVALHEGLLLTAKPDAIATSKVITYCYGATAGGVPAGQRFTEPQCRTRLAADLTKITAQIAPCITRPISVETYASFADFSYNVGAAAFCHASMTAKYNAGDYAGACNGLSAWVYSGGQKRDGLVKRRADERAMCLDGLT